MKKMTERTVQNAITSENKFHWSFWLGVSFFVLVITAILTSAWLLSERLAAEESVPVTSVKISGEMPYTTRSDIYTAIENVDLGNYFTVDVNEVQRKILNLPWVYSVSVRKHWPDELKVYVIDQKPIARWNEDFFLNQFGNAFQAQVNRVKHSIPTFFGPEGSEKIALENYINFNKLLNFSEMSIDELVLSERFAWQLTLNDGVTLNLGREKRIERIQRFMDAYPQIKDQSNNKNNQQVDYIDLRYDTGIAVGWKPAAVKQRV